MWKLSEITIFSTVKGGLKDVDIPSKITSLQYLWVKRLFNTNFHKWKIIFLIEKYFGKNFKFYGSLDIPQNFTEKFYWTGANCYLTILLYHRTYYLNIYGLINISKLEIKVYIFLTFQILVSILSVTCST